MSCLIIKNDGIGDLILASGLICKLAEHFKGQLDLVTCEQNREIAEMISGVRQIIAVSRDDLRFSAHLWYFRLLYGTGSPADLQLLKTIGNTHYEIAICLRRFIRQNSLVIMRNVKARRKFCAWQFPTNATRAQAQRSSRGWRQHQGTQDVLWEPDFYRSFLQESLGLELASAPILCLNGTTPSAPPVQQAVALGLGGASGRWPGRHWVALARLLVSRGWGLGLFGGPDALMLGKIIEQEAGGHNLVGKLGFAATATELARYRFYIGYDTSLSHFASLICKKVIVISGGGTFRRFFPWPGATNQYLIFNGMQCFDCSWHCKHPQRKCLTNVGPEDVMQYFLDVVTGSSSHERDLNPVNEQYYPGWRFSGSSRAAWIRPKMKDCRYQM